MGGVLKTLNSCVIEHHSVPFKNLLMCVKFLSIEVLRSVEP